MRRDETFVYCKNTVSVSLFGGAFFFSPQMMGWCYSMCYRTLTPMKGTFTFHQEVLIGPLKVLRRLLRRLVAILGDVR